MIEAFLVSVGAIALAELGDKTQFLALYLAARYRRPFAVLAGIAVAALASNIIAALIGHWIGVYLTPNLLRWILTVSFIAMAVWVLLPERDGKTEEQKMRESRHGAFIGTTLGFFLAELGDKTQLLTAALAARFDTVLIVITGSTIGMILANLPALIGGHYVARRVPVRVANWIAAAVFAVQAVLTFTGIEEF
jgi:Ca2+/H+ antiporter, TMEM165/GDT1 family